MSIRAELWLITMLVLTPSSAFSEPPIGYSLVWSDEFQGDNINPAEWSYRNDKKYWSAQKDENIDINNGQLVIILRKENDKSFAFSGGGIISKRQFSHGYFEAKFKTPESQGWHTSFWLTGSSNINDTKQVEWEIDIFENDSISPTSFTLNLHNWKDKQKDLAYSIIASENLSQSYHTLGCEYKSDEIRYYFDNKLIKTVSIKLEKPLFLKIWLTSIAAPLGGTKFVDESHLPEKSLFDYVRFYSPPIQATTK